MPRKAQPAEALEPVTAGGATSSHPDPSATTQAITEIPTDVATPPRWLKNTLTTLAYGIPLAFLAYVLYINFLPFGYNKTFIIDVGTEGDTDSSREFYLEPSRDLSERKVSEDGTNYRELNGLAFAVFNPGVVLKDTEITVSVEGEGIEIIPPVIEFDPKSVEWDYSWDFTEGKTPEDLGLTGTAYPFDDAMYFDGTSRLELPDSTDKFEDAPFSVYVEWTPTDSESNNQQIVGHFNWELWQNNNSVEFRIGRMNSATGTVYSIKYMVEPEFFYKKHNALLIYYPSENGYLEMYIDKVLADRLYIGNDIIWVDYGNHNLSFGWTPHGNNKSIYYSGNIQILMIKSERVLPVISKMKYFTNSKNGEIIYIATSNTYNLQKVSLDIVKNSSYTE